MHWTSFAIGFVVAAFTVTTLLVFACLMVGAGFDNELPPRPLRDGQEVDG